MNTHHVFFNDGLPDGGIGFQSFPDRDTALAFINDRLSQANGAGQASSYTLIKGECLALEARVVVTKVRVAQDVVAEAAQK